MKEYDVIIIGAGPAGLSAAIYTSRAGLSTLVVDESSAGGQVKTTHQVANYPGFIEPIAGHELANRMKEQAKKYGTKFELAAEISALELTADKKWIEVDEDDRYSGKFVIIATGRSPRRLGLPGELKNQGQAISYCATCDGEFYKDKDIFVIGGGNSAMEESLLLLTYVKTLTIIHQFDELQAEKVTADKVKENPKVQFLWSHEPRSFTAKENQIEVEIENLKTKARETITRDGVFIFVGMLPNNGIVKGTSIKVNDYGYIPTAESMETNVPGIYAIGDIRDKHTWQITVAVGEGTIAALEIVKQCA